MVEGGGATVRGREREGCSGSEEREEGDLRGGGPVKTSAWKAAGGGGQRRCVRERERDE